MVNSVTQRSDIIARLGSEEFAVVLPSTTSIEALEFSERLHTTINKAALSFNGSAISYTANIGLAECGIDAEDSLDDMLARAELARYQASQSGVTRSQAPTLSSPRQRPLNQASCQAIRCSTND